MLSDHGWTMLKPQPDSMPYCYVHSSDAETSEGNSVRRTTIKLGEGINPSHIQVRFMPKKKTAVERWVSIIVGLLVLALYVLLALTFWQLRTTQQELAILKDTVKARGYWEEDENQVQRVGMLVSSDSEVRRNQQPASPNTLPYGYVGSTTTVAPSSTERDKREADPTINHAFPLLAHYKGGLPESVIGDGAGDLYGDIGCPGLISPWFKDKTASGEFVLTNTTFKGLKGTVVVPESGLYFIYSQVFYLTKNSSNSYSIVLTNESGHENILATCSSPPNEQGESSCYTATARALRKDDRLQLKQRERNRHILLRPGQTFLGLVLLSPSPA